MVFLFSITGIGTSCFFIGTGNSTFTHKTSGFIVETIVGSPGNLNFLFSTLSNAAFISVSSGPSFVFSINGLGQSDTIEIMYLRKYVNDLRS
jgi:hypothetical protein